MSADCALLCTAVESELLRALGETGLIMPINSLHPKKVGECLCSVAMTILVQ